MKKTFYPDGRIEYEGTPEEIGQAHEAGLSEETKKALERGMEDLKAGRFVEYVPPPADSLKLCSHCYMPLTTGVHYCLIAPQTIPTPIWVDPYWLRQWPWQYTMVSGKTVSAATTNIPDGITYTVS